jgi:hypothetical protein
MKTKQISDLSLRTFANSTIADSWLATYAAAADVNNDLVFKGLKYNNQETGETYEAYWTGAVWAWRLVVIDFPEFPEIVDGGANIFVIDSDPIQANSIATPTYNTDPENVAVGATIVEDILVDTAEDGGLDNVQITIEWDSGKEYVGTYEVLDTTDLASTSGFPVIGTIQAADITVVGGSLGNDRRYRATFDFNSKPAGIPIERIRVYGNGGQSDDVTISRGAPVPNPHNITFDFIDAVGPNQTHVRSGQTYAVTLTYDLSTPLEGGSFTVDNLPTEVDLTGTGVQGTYNYVLSFTAGDIGNANANVQILNVPAPSSPNFEDAADINILTRNTQAVVAGPISAQSINGSFGVNVDNVLPTITFANSFPYPDIPTALQGNHGVLTQLAVRDFDYIASGERDGFFEQSFSINDGGLAPIDQADHDWVVTSSKFNLSNNSGTTSTLSGITFRTTGIQGTTTDATHTDAFSIQVTKERNKSSDTANGTIKVRQTSPVISNEGTTAFAASGTMIKTFNQLMLDVRLFNVSVGAPITNGGIVGTVGDATWNIAATVTNTTVRDDYTFDLDGVGESGIAYSETGKIVTVRGFNAVTINVNGSNLKSAGYPILNANPPLNTSATSMEALLPGNLTVTNPANVEVDAGVFTVAWSGVFETQTEARAVYVTDSRIIGLTAGVDVFIRENV